MPQINCKLQRLACPISPHASKTCLKLVRSWLYYIILYYQQYICLYFLLFYLCVKSLNLLLIWKVHQLTSVLEIASVTFISFTSCTIWLIVQQGHWICPQDKTVSAGISNFINLHQFTASAHINVTSFLSKTYTKQLGILRIQ